jgi:hypothetical protein
VQAPHDVLPVADGVGLPWDVPVEDAVGAIATARASYGDSFVLSSGGNDYLFTFSPTGVESFYALREEAASKGVADYLMLRRKLPDEVFTGRRLLPSTLFRRDDVSSYLHNLAEALDAPSTTWPKSSKMRCVTMIRLPMEPGCSAGSCTPGHRSPRTSAIAGSRWTSR